MKLEILIVALSLLIVGCSKPQSNQAIATKIDKLYQQIQRGVGNPSESDIQIEQMLCELRRRGYFERKEVVLDINPDTAEWTNVINQSVAFMKARESKGATLEIGPNLTADGGCLPLITKGFSIVIWDRPGSMNAWDELIDEIIETNQCMVLTLRVVYVVDDNGNPVKGAYVVGHHQAKGRNKQVITKTDELGNADIWLSGSVILEVGKKPYFKQQISSSSNAYFSITLSPETKAIRSPVESDLSDSKPDTRDNSPLWKEWRDYLQWLEHNEIFPN